MLKVVIAGDRGSGKTTVLGLLYATGVRSGSDKRDDFRFHTPFESLEEITVLFERLMSGGFPDSATKEGIHGLSFHLGSRRRGLFSHRREGEWAPGAFATLRFTLLRAVDEEVSRVLRGSSVADGRLYDILNSDAVAIVVDSTKLGVKSEEPGPFPLGEFDAAVESLLTTIRRLREPGGRRQLHPIFIFSKFDRVAQDVLSTAKVTAEPPRLSARGPRAAYAEALLEHNLPKTLARIRDRDRERLQFSRPSYFFTWVRTVEAAPGQSERIRLRRSGDGRWEPEYSRDEYLALLDCLRDLAMRAGH